VAQQQMITVRLIRSMIGHPKKHRAVLRGMGLTRVHKAVALPDTPQVRGMISKVKHLVRVETQG
jgi:large subunit ribosomal protein L30